MCSTSTHRISTPSRLHFTLIDMNGELGRVDGSLGLTIEHPGTSFDYRPSTRTLVRGAEPKDRQVVADEVVASSQLLEVEPNIEIEIQQMIPSHQGLGSGTQLQLAVLTALNHRFELGHSPQSLAEISNRGGTSGIGINAFHAGGLLLDGGHSVDVQKKSFAPSRFASDAGQPPLLMRFEFPATWGIVLFIPDQHHGLSGQDELEFMLANTPIPLDEVQATTHIILMLLFPALKELDLETFGSSVSALQDVGWKKRHWQRPDVEPLHVIRTAFQKAAEIHGCGLSSTGSTMFGFFDSTQFSDDQISDLLSDQLSNVSAIPGRIVCTRANNSGARKVALR